MLVKYTVTAQKGTARSTFSGETEVQAAGDNAAALSDELATLMNLKKNYPGSWTPTNQSRANELMKLIQAANNGGGSIEAQARDAVISTLVNNHGFSTNGSAEAWYVNPQHLSVYKSGDSVMVTGAASWGL